jgi:hypothetical protein
MSSKPQEIMSINTALGGFRRFSREVINAFAECEADVSKSTLPKVTPELLARFVDELVMNNLRLARRLNNLVSEHPDFEVLHEPVNYPYCFRFLPNALAERKHECVFQLRIDRLNQEIVEAIQRSGITLLMTTQIHGRVAIRLTACSNRVLEEEIDAAFEAIARWGRALFRFTDTPNEKSQKETMPWSSESYSLPTEVSAT